MGRVGAAEADQNGGASDERVHEGEAEQLVRSGFDTFTGATWRLVTHPSVATAPDVPRAGKDRPAWIRPARASS